jgi:hypothetical protein
MRANLLGTLAVFAVLMTLTVGLQAVNRALPAERLLPAGQVVVVGNGVKIIPPVGARVDVTRTLPNTGVLALVLRGLDLRVEAKATSLTLPELARRLRIRIQNQSGVQITGGVREVRTAAGVPGLRGTFSSTGREGLYVVYSSEGVSVQATASGSGLADQLAAVEDSLVGLTFR